MSTLSISPAFDFSRRPTTVRLTQRGRVVFVLAFLAAAFVVMVAFGGWATASHDAGTPEPVRVVEVQPGDTLYGIAGEVAEPGHVRDMVLHIQQLNSLSGAGLEVGQKLAIPKS
jgi:predicted Zn-dependent protease